MENTYTIKYYDLSEKEFENDEYLQLQVEEFGEGYTIEDYYSDNADVILNKIDNNLYYYEMYYEVTHNTFFRVYYETETKEKRYVIIIER